MFAVLYAIFAVFEVSPVNCLPIARLRSSPSEAWITAIPPWLHVRRPACQLGRLRSVLNTAVRSVTGIRRDDQTTGSSVRADQLQFGDTRFTAPCMGWHDYYVLVRRPIHRVAEVSSRLRLRSSSTDQRPSCQTGDGRSEIGCLA